MLRDASVYLFLFYKILGWDGDGLGSKPFDPSLTGGDSLLVAKAGWCKGGFFFFFGGGSLSRSLFCLTFILKFLLSGCHFAIYSPNILRIS